MNYQISVLNDYKDDDPTFEDYGKAKEAAIRMSYCDSPIGVWTGQDYGSEPLAIVFMQEVFEK